ncbi:MAG TPA: bifunctional pyr operon transcriptional regulator/uracil phosphoribosyltransferase PyrR [Bacteroidia bacterium]|nr:bifunctional pyr operon transcriptional regulator/uracil phosphoribosyltransferase PyrR [Bacteroidia bacterium]
MSSRLILNHTLFDITINRLCYELIENHNDFSDTVIIGLQPRGIYLANRIKEKLKGFLPGFEILQGNLDITFFRDDFRRREHVIVPSSTQIDFIIEKKKVVLVDDVLHTGRTIRAALDAILAFGRPAKVELLTLIDRKFSRDLPIEPNYTGMAIDTILSDKVRVTWKETEGSDEVWLFTQEREE